MAKNAEVFELVVGCFFRPMPADPRPLFEGIRDGAPGQTQDQTEEFYMFDLQEVVRVCKIPLTSQITEYLKACRIRCRTGAVRFVLTLYRSWYAADGDFLKFGHPRTPGDPVDLFPNLSIGESWVDVDPLCFRRLWDEDVFAGVIKPDLHGYQICIRKVHRDRYAAGHFMAHLGDPASLRHLFPQPELGETWESFPVAFIRRLLAENVPEDRETTLLLQQMQRGR